jgi:predicted ATPase
MKKQHRTHDTGRGQIPSLGCGRDVRAARILRDRTSLRSGTDYEALVLEPWKEIHAVDDERTMSFGDTVAFPTTLMDAYERAGYTLVAVPRASIESRVPFVRGFIPGR